MKLVVMLVMSILTIAVLTGCNTVQGIGQDIKAGGAAIERAATRAK